MGVEDLQPAKSFPFLVLQERLACESVCCLCMMEKRANYSGQLWSLVDQITVTLLSMAALF